MRTCIPDPSLVVCQGYRGFQLGFSPRVVSRAWVVSEAGVRQAALGLIFPTNVVRPVAATKMKSRPMSAAMRHQNASVLIWEFLVETHFHAKLR